MQPKLLNRNPSQTLTELQILNLTCNKSVQGIQ